MKKMTLLLVLFAVANLGTAQTTEAQKDSLIILQNIAQFSRDLVAGNYDAVVNAYTSDAKIFPNNTEILRGSDAIRTYWTPPADRKSRTIHHKIFPEEIKIIGNEAYDWGYYEGTTRMSDGEEVPWKGKYVIIWKEVEEGVWKIYVDIWNSIRD